MCVCVCVNTIPVSLHINISIYSAHTPPFPISLRSCAACALALARTLGLPHLPWHPDAAAQPLRALLPSGNASPQN